MARRRRALAFWRRKAVELQPTREEMKRALPRRLRATIGKLHVPLLEEMLGAVGYGDADLCADLVRGFPVCGEMHCGGMGKRVEGGRKAGGKPARGKIPELACLQARCAEINAATLARAKLGPLAAEVWEKTKNK